MSQENVELYRRAAENFLVGTTESDREGWITRIAEVLDPEIAWDASEIKAPELGGVHHGIKAVQRFWRGWFAAWEMLGFEYELVDAGDRVVMLLDQRMRGRSTGIEVSLGHGQWPRSGTG